MHRWIVRVAIAAVTAGGIGSAARSEMSPSLGALVAAFKRPASCDAITQDAILAEAPLRSLRERLDLSAESVANNSATSPMAIPVSLATHTENPLRYSTAGGRNAGRSNPLR